MRKLALKEDDIKESRDVFRRVFLSVDFHFFLDYMSFFNLRKLFLCAGRVNLCRSAFRSSSANLIRECVGAHVIARVGHEPFCSLGILLGPQRPGDPFGVCLQRVPSASEGFILPENLAVTSRRAF